jgi:hypothetical protein
LYDELFRVVDLEIAEVLTPRSESTFGAHRDLHIGSVMMRLIEECRFPARMLLIPPAGELGRMTGNA